MISMLTGLKVPSLACKCVFYRSEHNAKGGSYEMSFDGLKMQKWKIPIDRAQRVDERNGVICLVMFTPGVMVIKISKMAHFLYFPLITVSFCRLSNFFDISTLKRLYNSKAH